VGIGSRSVFLQKLEQLPVNAVHSGPSCCLMQVQYYCT
jgi:hypothetical protein